MTDRDEFPGEGASASDVTADPVPQPSPEAELVAAREEAERYRERWVRERADLENLKKRAERERADATAAAAVARSSAAAGGFPPCGSEPSGW